jgi:hypothetical protein
MSLEQRNRTIDEFTHNPGELEGARTIEKSGGSTQAPSGVAFQTPIGRHDSVQLERQLSTKAMMH